MYMYVLSKQVDVLPLSSRYGSNADGDRWDGGDLIEKRSMIHAAPIHAACSNATMSAGSEKGVWNPGDSRMQMRMWMRMGNTVGPRRTVGETASG